MNINLTCYLDRHNDPVPFRIELLHDAIAHLIADAREAYRVYELMMIRRPGDVWNYVWVRVLNVPESVASQIEAKRNPDPYRKERWPDDCIPLTEFDTFFYWCWDDTTPESETWLREREGKDFEALADKLFTEVLRAQAGLRASPDLLIQAELAALDRHQHHHDHDAKRPFKIAFPDYASPCVPKRSRAYYAKLRELLARPAVLSVASRGDEDFQTMRILAEEQRRRAIASGRPPGHDMPLHVLSDGFESFDNWQTAVMKWGEGLGYGDLMVDGDLNHGFGELIEGSSLAARIKITHHSEKIDIPGHTRTEGDGWVFYENTRSDPNIERYRKQENAAFMESLREGRPMGPAQFEFPIL